MPSFSRVTQIYVCCIKLQLNTGENLNKRDFHVSRESTLCRIWGVRRWFTCALHVLSHWWHLRSQLRGFFLFCKINHACLQSACSLKIASGDFFVEFYTQRLRKSFLWSRAFSSAHTELRASGRLIARCKISSKYFQHRKVLSAETRSLYSTHFPVDFHKTIFRFNK